MSRVLLLKGPLKERIWGSNYFKETLKITNCDDRFGELWSCSGHPEGNSIIINGMYQGETLENLFLKHPELFNYQGYDRFPVLVKLIATSDRLSVQVHPDDQYALEKENELGKTEGWLIIDKKDSSKIVCGHNAKNKEELIKLINENDYDRLLYEVDVKVGDFYPIYPGTIHAFGKDLVIIEIQQSSNVTYRFYDYNRKDDKGNYRQLHLDKAIEVTTYNKLNNETLNIYQEDQFVIWDNQYFTLRKMAIRDKDTIINDTGKAIIVTIAEGILSIENHQLHIGESFIILASTSKIELVGCGIVLITEVK